MSTRKEGASPVLKTAVEDRVKTVNATRRVKQRLQFCIQIRYVFHFVIRFKLLADICGNHKKYGVNLHAIFLGFDVFLVLCTICEKSARGYSDLRCVVRDGDHIYICS